MTVAMDVPNVMRKMADHLRIRFTEQQLPRIHSTPPSVLQASPSLVLYWDGTRPTEIVDRPGGLQEWTAFVLARLMIKHQGATPAEFGRLYSLLTPIRDAFAVAPGGQLQDIFRTGVDPLPGFVTKVQGVTIAASLQADFAGEQTYASDVMFEVQFKRKAGQ